MPSSAGSAIGVSTWRSTARSQPPSAATTRVAAPGRMEKPKARPGHPGSTRGVGSPSSATRRRAPEQVAVTRHWIMADGMSNDAVLPLPLPAKVATRSQRGATLAGGEEGPAGAGALAFVAPGSRPDPHATAASTERRIVVVARRLTGAGASALLVEADAAQARVACAHDAVAP